ncbi:MAG TPA: CBS domain-containing protein [Bauldia sp.]|nr:CBS domain-containing protein [Bauldia sp.]
MTVERILAAKGRDVVTTAPSKRVADAVATLARRRIGALVVVEDGDRIVGIVSERDIVRLIATKDADALEQPVSAIMTKSVVTCNEGETIDSVMARMTRGRFRHLPVVGEGRLRGIVSIGDVVKARIEQVEHEAEEMRAYIATA